MVTLTLLAAVTEGPAPEDVKAGWVALIIFLLLALAVAFLGWSLTKQLRKAQAAKDAGAYGDQPVEADSADEPTGGDSPTSV
ncbi:hypothetical protein [Nocardioides sp.]|uniref:hypothetical protein n=1 Tax=Nocardioides sp. TaxID=35761 RepID=UPI00286DB28D|nr:hypothetical protein [Nocardioides sp.]